MPTPSRRLSLVVLLALLALTLPAPRPALAASLVVNSLADSNDGACTTAPNGCTLREAINAANASAAADTISFGVDGTITPATPLPPLSGGGDTIDASSRAHKLVLSGQAMAAATPKVAGHGIEISSANNTVRGLVIVGFPFITAAVTGGSGIFISGTTATGNRIYDNWIGVGADGNAAAPNQYAGVLLDDGASNNIIGGTAAGQPNVIAGNNTANVLVQNVSGTANIIANNQIVGNNIGTNSAGTARVTDPPTGGLDAGILLQRWARGTVIRANLIGGHTGNSIAAGIKITSDVVDAGSVARVPQNTVIVGNRIGVTAAGVAIPNRVGVMVAGGARYGPLETQIGDPDDLAGGRNYIAGNDFRGVEVEDNQVVTGNTVIAGNYIGLAPSGTPVANGTASASTGGEGVWIGLNASNGATRTTLGPGNVIAASRLVHLRIRASGTIVVGNRIGTSPDGLSTSATSFSNAATVGFGSGALSVLIENGAGTRIGGPTASERNVIASGGSSFGGTGAPILIDPQAAGAGNNFCLGDPCAVSGTVVQGNYLGVKANGTEKLIASAFDTRAIEGLRIRFSTANQVRDNLIGGLGRGILLDTGANSNSFTDNLIGTTASGAAVLPGVPNSSEGIRIIAGSGNVFTGNIVAFNAKVNNTIPGPDRLHGIRVGSATGAAGATDNNQFIANRLFDNGTASIGAGIYIQNSQRVLVSRTTTESNGESGILLSSANNNIAAPALTPPADTATAISGSAPGCGAGCTVELFTGPSTIAAADRNEGPVYLAQASTGAGGAFSVSLAGCLDWVTTTVRDANNNTSPFSAAVDVSANTTCALPTITLSAATQSTRSVVAGSSTTYVHTVGHSSPIARTYNVVLSSSQGWASAPNTVSVPANGTATLEVVVSVPAGTASGTSDATTVRVVLAGTSAESNSQTDTTTAQVVVQNPAEAAVSPGQTKPLTANQTTFTHTVTNTGDLAGDFSLIGPGLAVGSPAGWSIASATLGKTRLNGGESTTLTIVVNNPAPLPGGDVTLSFRVAVAGGPSTDLIVDTIDVPVVRSFTFSQPTPASATTSPGNSVSFSYTVQNTGNAADTFQVSVPTPPAGLSFAVSPSTSFQLAAGASRTVTIAATVAGGVTPGAYAFTARAQAVGGASPPAAVDRQATVQVIAGGVPLFVGQPVVSPPEASFATQTPVAVTWSLRNSGNAAAPFSFALVEPLPFGVVQDGPITTTCAGNIAPTASGSSCTATLNLIVSSRLGAGSRTVTIEATANNSANGSANASAEASANVVIETVRDIEISAGTPASSGAAPALAEPGDVLTFSHTVSNLGNAPDGAAITVSQSSGLSWPVEVTPTSIAELARNGTATVTVKVTVPQGVRADVVNTISITARSTNDSAEADTAADVVQVIGVDAADLSPGMTKTAPVSTTVTFTHTLTNTGSNELTYRLEASNSDPAWDAPVIEPAGPLGPLAPGETREVTVRVTVPADSSGGVTNTTTLRVYDSAAAEPATALDSEEDVTRVGDPFDVLITPDNVGSALPDSTVVFTHTVTNIGVNRDSYRITTAEAGNVPTAVSPNLLDLEPGESQTISVTVRLPIRLAPGAPVFVRVTAESLTEPDIAVDSATDEITIGRVARVDLSASQVRGVSGGGEIRLDSLTLANRGNARDTFTLSFEDVTGTPGGLTMQATPSTITLDPDAVLRGIALRATVPDEIPQDRTRRVRVVARSSFDQSVVDSVIVQIVYLAEVQPPPPGSQIYLPMLAR